MTTRHSLFGFRIRTRLPAMPRCRFHQGAYHCAWLETRSRLQGKVRGCALGKAARSRNSIVTESKSSGTGLPASSAPAATMANGGLDKLLQQSRAAAIPILAGNEDNVVHVFLFDPVKVP